MSPLYECNTLTKPNLQFKKKRGYGLRSLIPLLLSWSSIQLIQAYSYNTAYYSLVPINKVVEYKYCVRCYNSVYSFYSYYIGDKTVVLRNLLKYQYS